MKNFQLTKSFLLLVLLVASIMGGALLFTPPANAASSPVTNYRTGDRVLKELITKCENGKTVATQIDRQRCRTIVTYLNHPSSRTKCNIQLSFTSSNKSKLDEDSVNDCRIKIDALNPHPSGGNGSGSGGSTCGEVKTFFNFGDVCDGVDKNASDDTNPIVAVALGILNFMAFGVALVVAGGIVYGGILYASARDSSSQTQQAMTIIVNCVIALVSFFFLWSIINFIVPGGLFQ